MNTLNRSFARTALVTALLLGVPAVAMLFADEVAWGPGDFIVGALLLFGAGMAMHAVALLASTRRQRALLGAVVLLALVTVWAELAVGLFH